MQQTKEHIKNDTLTEQIIGAAIRVQGRNLSFHLEIESEIAIKSLLANPTQEE
jgi:hypothetical protein